MSADIEKSIDGFEEEGNNNLFRCVFNRPDAARELCSAITGVNIPRDKTVEIVNQGNEPEQISVHRGNVSFVCGDRLVILEQRQSKSNLFLLIQTFNYYFRIINDSPYKAGFHPNERLSRIAPQFIVLYNGQKDCPPFERLKLSDHFLPTPVKFEEFAKLVKEPTAEFIVDLYNINYGFNQAIMDKSPLLSNYAFFIDRARNNPTNQPDNLSSIKEAISFCIDNDILKEYLEGISPNNVVDLLFETRSCADWLKAKSLESKGLKGRTKNLTKEIIKDANNRLKHGWPPDEVAEALKLSLAEMIEITSRQAF
ncbi:MAG: hypothetical protein LBS60_01310 [Deltaproteobacteria bacterium]|jgi:hypothetical protein|nr:hypothetical protein [Deltaproteobacteria bacterium]